MTAANPFSDSYAEARHKFLAAAGQLGLSVRSWPHPLTGRDGEALAMDAMVDGPADSDCLLVLSSACHGVEGFCGSGAQLALLQNEAWRASLQQTGTAVLYLHGINPWGFSWWRRTTHENVDLNRNFVDFAAPLPVNTGYDALAEYLVPAIWPPRLLGQLQLLVRMGLMGSRAAQAAVSTGQYTHADGLFFGGRSETWSQSVLRQALRDYGQGHAKIAWVDLHSGLGPSGVGERIFAARQTAKALARARAWWGAGVTSAHDDTSVSLVKGGQMWSAIYEECPQAEYTGIGLEFGTVPLLKVLHALRGDQWLANNPDAPEPLRVRIKQEILAAFYINTPEWQQRVIEQTTQVMWQALHGINNHA